MKIRFFFASAIYRTWAKLFVLTENGTLYCEYLNYFKRTIISEQVNFNTFTEKDYLFENYQPLKEISKEEAVSINLTSQANWIQKYLSQIATSKKSSTSNRLKDLKNDYLERLSKTPKLKLVIVGQDPYPSAANGIAFCKNTFNELLHPSCCGKEILFSLDLDVESAIEKFSTPIELFFDLLENGIAFINVNHELFSNQTQDLSIFKSYNQLFLEKTEHIIVLGLSKAKEAFQQYYSEFENVEFIIHPSGKAKLANPIEWKKKWNNTYLKNKYLI